MTPYVYVAGWYETFGDDTIFKLTDAGAVSWAARAATIEESEEQSQEGVAIDPAGNVYVTGDVWWEYPGGVATSRCVSKFSAAGALVWHATVADGVAGNAIATMPNGNVLVGHNWTSHGGSDGETYASVTVLDGDDGTYIWSDDTGDSVRAAAVDEDSNCYVGGDRVGGIASVWAYAPDGTPLWSADYGADVKALAVDPTQTYLYVAGVHQAGVTLRRFALATGVEDTSGDWPLDYDAGSVLSPTAGVCCDGFGNIYVVTDNPLAGLCPVFAYTAAGALLWTTDWDTTNGALCIAVTPGGTVYVGGDGDNVAQAIRRYDADTGTEDTTGWPPVTVDNVAAVAVTPGLVGAYPDAWLPDPYIYVGRVDFE